MILTFRPIKVWPDGWQDQHRSRVYCPFTAPYSATLDLLDRELYELGATSAMLQVDASERDCRLDGQLRADAKVRHPGVILTVDTKRHGTLIYATDQFVGRSVWQDGRHYSIAGWQANLRAIALGLEALRKVERYGIAERGQQYAGYRELPSGIALGSASMTVEAAAAFIAEWADDGYDVNDLLDSPTDAADAYRRAAKRLHPDAGGDTVMFQRLQDAKKILDESSIGA